MKLTKIALLLAGFSLLVACSPNNENKSTSGVESNTSTSVESSSSSSESREDVSSSSSSAVSTSESSSSSSTSSSEPVVTDTTLTVSFYNPSCGSLSKEVINERLATYINEVATTTFVSSITSHDCQVTNNIPTNGEKVLQLGAAASTGSMTFAFTTTIKSITVKAQGYYKPWVDTWTTPGTPITYNNTDPNSVLEITTTGNAPKTNVDLKPGEDEQPVEKEFTLDINANTLTLGSANEENGRVFIKEITFVY